MMGMMTQRTDTSPAWIVTIDGPAASGKSSVAQRVAEELGIPYVSSGLLYRAATYLVLREGGAADDETAVMVLLSRHRLRLEPGNRVWCDDQEISSALHTDTIDAAVSAVSRHPAVRRWAYDLLRELRRPFVIDGRDMGTVAFPDATHKFYLTASAEARAQRRRSERNGSLRDVIAALERRDALDHKQLRPAPDACQVDTTALTLDEVVAKVLACLKAP